MKDYVMQLANMRELDCPRCGLTYPEIFFRKSWAYAYAQTYRRSNCLGCELKDRDEQKKHDRWKTKANDAFRRHADKYIKLGLAKSRGEFAEKFGWDVEKMAHQAKHCYENGCRYCGEPFCDMGHGLADITLDVTDPKQAPFYSTNTAWICGTCNREKGRRSASEWALILICWARWRKRQAAMAIHAYIGPLFEWTPRLFHD